MQSKRAVALITLASLSTALAFPGASKATIFTVGGQQYDVTTFTGSYHDNASLFNTPSNGGAMPWWGDYSFAEQFAGTVGSAFGNNLNFQGTGGPLYPIYFDEDFGLGGSYSYTLFTTFTMGFPMPEVFRYDSVTYARASLYTPPATATPGPLPILGAASAFGMSRRLRRRIASQAFKL